MIKNSPTSWDSFVKYDVEESKIDETGELIGGSIHKDDMLDL